MSSAKRNLVNSLLVILSIFFSLYAAESILLFKDFLNRHPQTRFDSRTKYEIYRDLKQQQGDITIYVSPTHWREDSNSLYPFSGISNRKTIHCNENSYYSIYSSDRYGFNNLDSEWEKASVDFLIIGDSFAQGACVNEKDSIAGYLRRLSGKSVLNLGMGGNGPLIEFAAMREYFPKTNAKIVFWTYYEGNDLLDLSKELKNETLRKYLEDPKFSQELIQKQSQINQKAAQIIENWVKENQQNPFVKFLYLKTLSHFISEQAKYFLANPGSLAELKKVLTQASDLAAKEKSQFYFVFIPSRQSFRKKQKNTNSKEEIFRVVRELNLPIIDIQAAFLEEKTNPLSFYSARHAYHLNEAGYRLVSQYLLRSLTKTVSAH
jgi:hypothetical protein